MPNTPDDRAAFGLTEDFDTNSKFNSLDFQGIGGAALVDRAQPKTHTWGSLEDKRKVVAAGTGNTVVWDFDGVVADTEPRQWESFRTLLGKRGFVPEAGFHTTLMGHTEPKIWELLFAMGAPEENIDELMDERSKIYVELATRTLRPSWVAAELIPMFANLAEKQYIISNGNYVNNTALVNHWGLQDMVEVVDKKDKTKEQLFIHHATTSQTVIFEDTERYANIGKTHGAFVVGVFHSLSLTKELTADVTVNI